MHARTILRRGALAIGGLGAAFLGYAGGIERRWLAVTEHRVEMVDIPPEWDGVRIIQLSDFHLGMAGAPYAMLERAVAETVAQEPDLIVLTGDYSNDGRPRPLDLLAPLAKTAPTIAVLGNHDYLQRTIGADLIARELEKQGVTVLRNDLTAFVHDGVAGIVVGFEDDLEGPGADVKGLVARMQGKSPSIVLAHEPDVIDRFPDRWAGLTLSGHTHSAQIRLSPIRRVDWIDWPISEMQSAYPRGWFRVRGNRLYVSHGLGVSSVPLRFCARPELTCFTLTHVEADAATALAVLRGAANRTNSMHSRPFWLPFPRRGTERSGVRFPSSPAIWRRVGYYQEKNRRPRVPYSIVRSERVPSRVGREQGVDNQGVPHVFPSPP